MLANNATQLYNWMLFDIRSSGRCRTTVDPSSPTKGFTTEARFGTDNTLLHPTDNFVAGTDPVWCVANTLHFFSATERAAPLRKYNANADRFMTGDEWIGAYGAIAMPQLCGCIRLLKAHPATRRAVISMGGFNPQDINRPACWSFLHFLKQDDRLHLQVYQRSLALHIAPFDCVLLTNILFHVSRSVGIPVGKLLWTVGSLHARKGAEQLEDASERGLVVRGDVLADPDRCWDLLESGFSVEDLT